MVDCYLRGLTADLREFNENEIDKANNSFAKFLEFWDKEHLHPYGIEEQMVSERYRYGGTVDLVARDEDQQYVLLDWKTSKKVYQSHKWQVGGYEQLWNENHPDKIIQRRAIIRIGREEGDAFQDHWITTEEIRKCINVFAAQAFLYNTIKANK